jgi:ceramide glucosyltransferase
LVAPFVGVSEFGLGSTLAFRRTDLDRIGGFEAIADYLADDYQLGCKLHALGRRNVIAKPHWRVLLSNVPTISLPKDWPDL